MLGDYDPCFEYFTQARNHVVGDWSSKPMTYKDRLRRFLRMLFFREMLCKTRYSSQSLSSSLRCRWGRCASATTSGKENFMHTESAIMLAVSAFESTYWNLTWRSMSDSL